MVPVPIFSPCDLVTVGSLFVELTPHTPGVPLSRALSYDLVAGGSGANVVFALARLGIRVRFITAVGDDDFGDFLVNELATFNIDVSGVRRVPRMLTPVSFSAMDGCGGKQFRFYRFPGYCDPLASLTQADFAPTHSCRLLAVSEGSIREPRLRRCVLTAMRDAREANVTVSYMVNLRRSAWRASDETVRRVERKAIALADIVQLNEEEAVFLTCEGGSDGVRRIRDIGPHVVVLTRGGEGDILLGINDTVISVPPYRVPVVYDVGAGDTFHAGLLASALRMGDLRALKQHEWTAAVCFAAATAAIRVSNSSSPRDLPTFTQVQSWQVGRRGAAT